MEVTFMPARRKLHSVNFLEKFKDKLNRVDRYSGILGVLNGRSHRYDSTNNQSCISKKQQSKTIQYHSNTPSRVKTIANQHVGAPQHTSTRVSRSIKQKTSVQYRLARYRGNKENEDESNLMESQLFLPRLNAKSIANSKCPNRIKSRVLSRKQSKGVKNDTIQSRVLLRHQISPNLEEYN